MRRIFAALVLIAPIALSTPAQKPRGAAISRVRAGRPVSPDWLSSDGPEDCPGNCPVG